MTLNQIIKRIRQTALAHKQIKNFYTGLVADLLTDKTTRYASAFLQDDGGTISASTAATKINFKLFLIDLVHVSADAKDNEQDVHSDMLSVAIDMMAELSKPAFNDWKISKDNSVQFLVEEQGDMFAGVSVDFSVEIMFTQNICQIPK